MSRVLALTQFLIIGFGGPILLLLVKIGHKHEPARALAPFTQYLATHMLWLFAIPILYAIIGNALRGKVAERSIQTAGIVIVVLLAAMLGTLIVLSLR